jgi:hypothetical protein
MPGTLPFIRARTRWGTVRWALTVSLTVAAAACSSNPRLTELRVVVDSDLSIPTELSAVRATVRSPGEDPSTHTFELAGDGAVRLPLSFSVVPRGGDTAKEVAVAVDGLVDEEVVVRSSATTRFRAGKRLSLPLFLLRDCVDVSCEQGETCVEAACVSDEVDASSLREITGSADPAPPLPPSGRPDAGNDPQDAASPDARSSNADAASDARVDPVIDATVDADGAPVESPDADSPAHDTGTDSSMPLQIPCGTLPCACPPDDTCTLSCDAPGCAIACADARCTIEGPNTEDLEVSCDQGADCTIDARESRKALIRCDGQSRCDIDCGGSTNCRAQCPNGACTLDCLDATGCRIEQCPTEVSTCASTLACGTDC